MKILKLTIYFWTVLVNIYNILMIAFSKYFSLEIEARILILFYMLLMAYFLALSVKQIREFWKS